MSDLASVRRWFRSFVSCTNQTRCCIRPKIQQSTA